MTWKDIEENLRHITTDIGCCSGDLCPGDHDGRILGFFKSQFKQAMEEMVKLDGEDDYMNWYMNWKSIFEQEMLDKLNKFFE